MTQPDLTIFLLGVATGVVGAFGFSVLLGLALIGIWRWRPPHG